MRKDMSDQSVKIQDRGYKTFLMLNSIEPEIWPLMNLKLLTIANSFLLNIAENENFSANKYEKANFC